ncbi:M1-specific T cell receptor alpha chain-like [Xyrauchen texanus]|uniref:M1-specific T cell receptor alpha chain-like n=1 Tax=Xyrauchen texanus TaxID=154827 RepID=UPI002242BF3E|nr:M1-specific T cell receptor alpha chain-like [Xyrauchen texanus]
MIFGKGSQLTVLSKKEVKPSIYKVGDSCLATDFTNHDAVNLTEPFSSKKITAVRYEGQNYYSSFSIDGECHEQGSCSSSSSSDQSVEIEKDEKINFLSVGIFWLRILFLKTVVFNVLVTFKAWMS